MGGASVIAINVAKIWLKDSPIKIILIVRNLKKLEATISELRNINPLSEIICKEIVFDDLAAGQKLIDQIFDSNIVSKVLIAFGTLPNQLECEGNSLYIRDTLFINGILSSIKISNDEIEFIRTM